jgi:hypothetical protein
MYRVTQLGCAACLLVLAAASPARGEPFAITDGSAFVITDWEEYWTRTFDNWGTLGLPMGYTHVPAHELFANARTGCSPCAAGDTVNLSSAHELRGPGFIFNSMWGTGVVNFHAGDVTIPSATAGSVGVDLIVPFEFDGVMSLYRTDGTVLFSGPLTGTGYTRAVFWGTDSRRVFHQQSYEFGANAFASPVPEPGTWFLVATGAWAMVRRRRAQVSH